MIDILSIFLANDFRFVAINHEFSTSQLPYYEYIKLFIIDVDQPFINVEKVLNDLDSDPNYRNIPRIGLSLKKHHASLPPKIRKKFQDFVLMPCGNEDLLTRIEVWIKTFEKSAQSVNYSEEIIKQKQKAF